MNKLSRLLIGISSLSLMCAVTSFGAVSTVENEDSVTGYTTTFTYSNADATNVKLNGSFYFMTENDENLKGMNYALPEGTGTYDFTIAPENWNKEGNYHHVFVDNWSDDMVKGEDGVWTYSIDLPGGYYVYRLSVSYNDGAHYDLIADPSQPSRVDTMGVTSRRSVFYVPYDAEKQSETDDWTWATPLEDESQAGTVFHFNYPGYGDVYRAAMIYLPNGYDAEREEPYKVLYISHGGGGNETDWFTQSHADFIADRKFASGEEEPFIIVTMNNTAFGWDYQVIHDNMKDYLIPYMEQNYNVVSDASGRAFAGLSMGGMTTNTLLYIEPELFGYYGIFSGSNIGSLSRDDYSAFADARIFIGAGFADNAHINSSYQTDTDRTSLGLAETFDALGIAYNNGNGLHLVQGGHDWYTWDLLLRDFIDEMLWK